DLGGLADYGWAFSGFMLANVVGITVAGRRTDRVGPWAPFAGGAVIFGAGLCLGGLAPTMLALIGARVVQGAGGGALSSVIYASVARAYPEERRPRMLAMLSTAWVLPGLVRPAVAGVVADQASWRLVFFGLVPIVAIAAALTLPALAGLAPAGAREDAGATPRAAVLLSGGLVLALIGAQQQDVVVGLALLVAGIAVARPGFQRLMPAGTLGAAPGLPAAIAAMGLVSVAFLGTETFFPLLVTEVHHRSTTLAGLALSAATLTWTTGAWVQARLAPQRTRRRRALVGWGALVLATGLAGLTLPLFDATPLWAGVVAWALAGLGMGIAHATISLVVLDEAAAGGEGAASAGMQLASVLGVALGAGVGGAAIAAATARGWGPQVGFAIGLAIPGAPALRAL